jgi:hypothetical protein
MGHGVMGKITFPILTMGKIGQPAVGENLVNWDSPFEVSLPNISFYIYNKKR